ncbi:hypothetical protein ACH4TE_04330 [Streptomyces sioyaensis]|uniref:hypothetical protein n=1 Tax=Streptomyces sioyaensis TaxID=67364 RepID=UPI0037A5773A
MTAMRVVAAAGSVVAAAVNVSTGMLTQNWTAAWWACTAVLVALGAVLAVWQVRFDGAAGRRQHVQGVESRSLEQAMNGPGEQVVRDSKVERDVIQRQED